ncbi:MAG TPA: hypothetical protein DCK99_19225 [Blastocatellia bacterium]|nr:hypothetical protein [Blastocatellia bacterium]
MFAVRKRGEILKGVYAQYDLRADETLKVSPENFSLMRTKIPFWRRVKMVLGRQPYCSYNDVKDLYDAALAKHQPRGASAVEAGSQSLT